MIILKCKMCGGDIELSPDKTIGNCGCCGNTVTLPKINNDKKAAAYNRGNHFRRIGEFDKALEIYENILEEDNTNAEAHWCCALCRFGIEYVEDPDTFEWIPTCHRVRYDSFLEDIDYLAAIEYSEGITQNRYRKEANKIYEVQRNILTVSQKEEPYDVFICYKETDENGNRTIDSTLAQDIYTQLTKNGKKVFFSRITLEDKVGSEYEPYIFSALNTAKIMLLIGTKPEYVNSVWVKNEWKRFLEIVSKDHTKVLIPCYRDMDPYDLPEELNILQADDMGKIGFIQDLLRKVSKIMSGNTQDEESASGNTAAKKSDSISTVFRRGMVAFEAEEWKSAKELFDSIIEQDPNNIEAHIYSILADRKKTSLEAIFDSIIEQYDSSESYTTDINSDQKKYLKSIVDVYEIPDYLSSDEIVKLYDFNINTKISYNALCFQDVDDIPMDKFDEIFSPIMQIDTTEAHKRCEEIRDAFETRMIIYIMDSYFKFNKEYKEKNEKLIKYLNETEDKVKKLHKKAKEKRENDYQDLCKRQTKSKNFPDLDEVKEKFEKFGDYKDCKERAEQCVKASKKYSYTSNIIIVIISILYLFIDPVARIMANELDFSSIPILSIGDINRFLLSFISAIPLVVYIIIYFILEKIKLVSLESPVIVILTFIISIISKAVLFIFISNDIPAWLEAVLLDKFIQTIIIFIIVGLSGSDDKKSHK